MDLFPEVFAWVFIYYVAPSDMWAMIYSNTDPEENLVYQLSPHLTHSLISLMKIS